ncbi:MAG TPA: hypothetical protein VEU47_18610 [Candidatus Cybelea sp.]|nr:hypothetical protein [Candidatus Cybelea sp.]
MIQAPDIARALDDVVSEVARAGVALADGRAVEIGDLPDRVAPICQAIAALPKDQAVGYAPVVRSLMEKLDALTGGLRQRRDALRQKLADRGVEPS